MLPYWLMFICAALPAIETKSRMILRADGTRKVLPDPAWVFVMVVLTMIIGFRYNVGGDWYNYSLYLQDAEQRTIGEVLLQDDPGFRALNWFSVLNGWGRSGVNIVSGLLFSTGLVLFCRSLPRPWLALAVAIPYVVIVVGMGYTRQAVALGIVMAGLVALGRQRFVVFMLCVLIGATFHKSAVLMIPLAALTLTRNRYLGALMVVAASGIGYVVLLQEHADRLLTVYTDQVIVSEGALIRLGMNFLPALIFLKYRKRFVLNPADYKLWRLFALISVAMFIAFFATSMSTALDRLALYMIPLQLVVAAHLPDLIGKPGRHNVVGILTVLAYMTLVLFVWLNFATHSRFWVPYRVGIG